MFISFPKFYSLWYKYSLLKKIGQKLQGFSNVSGSFVRNLILRVISRRGILGFHFNLQRDELSQFDFNYLFLRYSLFQEQLILLLVQFSLYFAARGMRQRFFGPFSLAAHRHSRFDLLLQVV